MVHANAHVLSVRAHAQARRAGERTQTSMRCLNALRLSVGESVRSCLHRNRLVQLGVWILRKRNYMLNCGSRPQAGALQPLRFVWLGE